MKKLILSLIFSLNLITLASAMTQPNIHDQAFLDQLKEGDAQALTVFRDHAAQAPWLAHYMAALGLFQTGHQDEAVKWFYTGQFRGRVAAHFDPDPQKTAALSGALNDVVGRPINEYAGGDQERWVQALDAAILWTKQNPYSVETLGSEIEGDIAAAELQDIIARNMEGMTGLRDQIAQMDPAHLKARRRANGLE